MNIKGIRLAILTSAVLLVVAAGLSIRVLWPTRKEIVKPPQVNSSKSAEQGKTNPRAANLHQAVKGQKPKSDSYINPEYTRIIASCRKIIEQYPDTPQAEKARRLLRRVTAQYATAGDGHTQLVSSGKPEIKRSRPIRRQTMPRETMDMAFGEIGEPHQNVETRHN